MFDHCTVDGPYPGLRPFEPHEGEIFFGREGHTDRLLEILQRERFLAVIGPSGSGKSSLVRAGLLPALAGGRLGTGSHWRLALLRPGGQPLLALAQALTSPHALGVELMVQAAGPPAGASAAPLIPATPEQATPDAALIASELRQGPGGLDRILTQAQARRLAVHDAQRLASAAASAALPLPTLNLLVLADQFEEVFTYRSAGVDRDEPTRFVDLLLHACRRGDSSQPEPSPGGIRVVVALTMRTDFLGQCVEFADLPEAINHTQYLTPRLKRDELRAAMVGPARLFGGDVDAGFVEATIDEAGADSDQLPLLQHALAQWWREARRADPDHPVIDLSSTQDAGTLREALNRHAERLYGAMPPPEQQACEALFRAITAGREGADAVRRPQRLADIATWSGVTEATLIAVVQQLAAPEVSFVHHGRTLDRDSVIDLTHEASMRQWGRLKDWVASELRRGQGWWRWQTRAAEHEDEQSGGQGSLLTGTDLTRALDWWNPSAVVDADPARWEPTAAWAQRYAGEARKPDAAAGEIAQLRQYLVDSHDQARRAQEAEQARLQQQALAAQERAERERALADAARQSAQRARRISGLAVVIALFALLAAGVAAWQFRATRVAEQARTESLFESQLTHASLLARVDDYAAARQVLIESAKLDGAIAPERRQARNLLAGHVATMGGAPADLVYTDGGRPLPALSGGVALSPDGQLLAVAGEKGTLVLFNEASGQLLKRLVGHDAKASSTGDVRAIVFAPDGQSLYSGGDDGRVIRWAIPAGDKLGEWRVDGEVRGLAMRPDGRQLAAGHDRVITLHALPGGREERRLEGHENSIADGTSLAYSPDGQRLASASFDRNVRLWNLGSGKPLQVLRGHTDVATGVAFSPDGRLLATSSYDRRIVLWRADTGEQVRVLSGHQNIVFGLRFSADGQRLYSASRDNTMRAWDVASGALQRVWQGHEAGLWSVDLALPEGAASTPGRPEPWAYTAADDGTLRRWPLAAAGRAEQSGLQPPIGAWAWATQDGTAATAAAIAPDGRWTAVGLKDGTLRLHALPGGEVLGEVEEAHRDAVFRIAFSPDGRQLATCSFDGTAKLWAVAPQSGGALKLTPQHTFSDHRDAISAVAFAPDGRRLATASYDGQVGLYDLAGFQGRLVKAHDGQALSVSFDASGQWLLTGGSDLHVQLWRTGAWADPAAAPRELVRLQDTPMWISLAPDGRRAAVVGRGSAITLLDLARPDAAPQRLVGHENTVMKATHTPDGRLLATVSGDMTLRVWDLHQDLDRQRLLFTQRLPAVSKAGPQSPLWDFDFRCVKDSGDCWAVVPLTMDRVVVYRWPYTHLPDGWKP